MAFLYLLELVAIVCVSAFVGTQVIVPLMRGGKLWPWWHRRAVLKEVHAAEEDLTQASIKQFKRDLQEALKKRQETKGDGN